MAGSDFYRNFAKNYAAEKEKGKQAALSENENTAKDVKTASTTLDVAKALQKDSKITDAKTFGVIPEVIVQGICSDGLWVADSPLKKGGIPKKLSIAEFQKIFKINYTESIMIPQDLKDHKFEDDATYEKSYKQVEERLKAPMTDNLVICHIDDEVGYGVFAKNEIKVGTILAVYAGIVKPRTNTITSDYGMAIDDRFGIDAKETGGIARFVQHLPFSLDIIIQDIRANKGDIAILKRQLTANGMADLLSEKEFESVVASYGGISSFIDNVAKGELEKSNKESIQEIKELKSRSNYLSELAYANVKQYTFERKGKPYIYYQVCRDIKPGEQIGISYDLGYWKLRNKIPKYFKTSGEVIDFSLHAILHKHNLTDDSQESLEKGLRSAANSNQISDLKLFIKHVKNINSQDLNVEKKFTALHLAVIKNHIQAVEVLIKAGARIDIKNAQNKTVVDYAETPELQNILKEKPAVSAAPTVR